MQNHVEWNNEDMVMRFASPSGKVWKSLKVEVLKKFFFTFLLLGKCSINNITDQVKDFRVENFFPHLKSL